MGKDKAKDKEQYDGKTTTSETISNPWDAHQDACQSTQDLSQDCKAWMPP